MLIPPNMGSIDSHASVDSGFVPVMSSAVYLHDDLAIMETTGALVPTQRSIRRNTGGSIVIDSAVYASIPQLSVVINRAGAITFDYWLVYVSSDVTEGIGVQVAFSGTATGINYSIEAYTDPNTRAPLNLVTAFGSGVAPYANGPGASRCIVKIYGSCQVTQVGQLDLQIRAETGNPQSVTLLPASTARVFG